MKAKKENMEQWTREPVNDVQWQTLPQLQGRSTAQWIKQTKAEMYILHFAAGFQSGYGASHLLHLLKENNNANFTIGNKDGLSHVFGEYFENLKLKVL